MPNAIMRFETVVPAEINEVFDYVSDLTKHGEWSANRLEIAPLDENTISVGKRYKSKANVKNLTFEAELTVTEYSPHKRFAFNGEDSTGVFTHLFTFEPVSNGTKVVRSISFQLSLYLWLRFWILYLPVRRPAGRKAMKKLTKVI